MARDPEWFRAPSVPVCPTPADRASAARAQAWSGSRGPHSGRASGPDLGPGRLPEPRRPPAPSGRIVRAPRAPGSLRADRRGAGRGPPGHRRRRRPASGSPGGSAPAPDGRSAERLPRLEAHPNEGPDLRPGSPASNRPRSRSRAAEIATPAARARRTHSGAPPNPGPSRRLHEARQAGRPPRTTPTTRKIASVETRKVPRRCKVRVELEATWMDDPTRARQGSAVGRHPGPRGHGRGRRRARPRRSSTARRPAPGRPGRA